MVSAEEIQNKLFKILSAIWDKSKSKEEMLNFLKEKAIRYGYKEAAIPKFNVYINTEREGLGIHIKAGDSIVVFCRLAQMPSCCGQVLLHEFSYTSNTYSDWDDFIIECIDKAIHVIFKSNYMPVFTNNRFIINFVQPFEKLSEEEKKITTSMPDNYKVPDDVFICYPLLYRWAKQQKIFKTLDVMKNVNTNNLIHLCEVYV